MNIGCVLLAAGLGRRFGGEKLMVSVEGTSLFERTLDALPRDCFAQIAAVCRQGKLLDTARAAGITAVLNRAPEEGISGSVRLGLAAMKGMDGVLFAVCDQPFLTAESIQKVVNTFTNNPGYIVAASWQGERGNPVLFPAEYFPALAALTGDCGGGAVIARHQSRLRLVEVGRREELFDIDRPQDLAPQGL